MLKIIITERAEIALDDIADFYSTKYNIDRAIKVLDSIDEIFLRIAKAPFNFPKSFDIKQPDDSIRQAIVHDTFKVIFQIQDDCVEIIEIFHGNRNPELLKDI
ncbi:MAG TPA: type II toxin-antitoxin system RelE/ParE family toxin [Chitinophagales bacterium]|nr:type II toxin-antitoxin system RelE/ParE family toxin [Chitinophagales bacterium]